MSATKANEDSWEREKNELEREIKELKKHLAVESRERDNLEKENLELSKVEKQLSKRVKQLEQDLQRESQERDTLDQEYASSERQRRSLEQELKNIKMREKSAEEDINRLKDTKQKLTKKIEDLEREHEKESEKYRDDLRQAKKELREKTRKLEAEKESLEKELKRADASKKLQQQVKTLERELQTANQKLKMTKSPGSGGSEELFEENAQLVKEKDKLEEKLNALQEQVALLQNEKQELQGSRKELEEEITTLKKKLSAESERAKTLEQEKQVQQDHLNELERKHKAELQSLKTKATEEDLDVLRNLLQEESGRRKELEGANEELEIQLSQLKVDLAEHSTSFNEEREDYEAEITALQEEIEILKKSSEKSNQGTSAEADNRWREKLEKEIKQTDALAKEKESLETELRQLKREHQRQITDLQAQTDQLVRELKGEKESLGAIRLRQKAADEEKEALQSSFEKTQKSLQADIGKLKADLETSSNEKEKAEKELKRLIRELNVLKQEFDAEHELLNKEKEFSKKLQTQLEDFTKRKEDETKDLEKTRKQLERVQSRAGSSKETIDTLEKEKKKLEDEIIQLNNKLKEELLAKERIRDSEKALSSELKRLEASQTKDGDKLLVELKEKLEQAQLEQERLRKLAVDNQDEINDIRGELQDEVENSKRLESERVLLREKIIALEDKIEEEIDFKDAALKEVAVLEKKLQEALEGKEARFKAELEKEKQKMQLQLDTAIEDKKEVEAKSKKLEQELSQMRSKLDDEVRLKEEFESNNKKLQAKAKTMEEKLQESEKYKLAVADNAELKKKVEEFKRKWEDVNEELQKLQLEHQRKVQQLQQKVDEKKQVSFSQDNTEVLALKKQVEQLQKELASRGQATEATSAENVTAPRLTHFKRVGPARSGKRPPASTITAKSNDEVEETPVETPKKDLAGMGGVHLLGGINLASVALKSRVPAAKPSGPVSKLYQLKGRRRIRSFQVELSSKSLNSGDVFVLDTGNKIFQWNGKECNRMERTKGKDIIARLKRQSGNKAELIVLDEEDAEEPGMFQFWKELGGKGDVSSAQAGGDDLEYENYLDSITKLYRITDQLDLVSQGKLLMEMLDSNGVFVLDCLNEMYLWVGKSSPKELRNLGMKLAEELRSQVERPTWVDIVRSSEGGESVIFCEKFSNWPDGATLGPQKFASNVAKSKPQEKIDTKKMHAAEPPTQSAFKEFAHDDGTVEMWVVNEATKAEIPPDKYGQLWDHNSYIILHTYGPEGSSSYTVYFWQGRWCNKNEKGTSAALAMNLAKKMRGATQVRVVQNKEPKQFLKLFKGKLIVHRGNHNASPAGTHLYHIRGTSEEDTSIMEVQPTAKLLNSTSSFYLKTNTKSILWIGKYSSTFASQAAQVFGDALEVVQEGNETAEFWKLLGGKTDYFDASQVQIGWIPKFFNFSNASGTITADPVFQFSFDDLTSESIILLDTLKRVYLWTGNKAREADKKFAMETVLDYVAQAPDVRNDADVICVNEGEEPLNFIAHFHVWDREIPLERTRAKSVAVALQEYNKVYTLRELQDRESLPATVDKTKLEIYLNDDEFEKLFGMDKQAWNNVPLWKQSPKKKELGFF